MGVMTNFMMPTLQLFAKGPRVLGFLAGQFVEFETADDLRRECIAVENLDQVVRGDLIGP